MRDVQKTFDACVKELRDAGYSIGDRLEVKVGDEEWSKRYDGYCVLNDNGSYTITIAKIFFREDCPWRLIREVFFHELLHTVQGCMNHGLPWQSYAGFVDKEFGTNILNNQLNHTRPLYGFKP